MLALGVLFTQRRTVVHSYQNVFDSIRLFLQARLFAPEDAREGVFDGNAMLAEIERVEGLPLEVQETYLRQYCLALEEGRYFNGEPLLQRDFNPWTRRTTETVLKAFPDLLEAVLVKRG